MFDYDFYRFARLVHSIHIDALALVIPYDIELEIIEKSYQGFSYSEGATDTYQEQVNYIQSDKLLLSRLKQSNEA